MAAAWDLGGRGMGHGMRGSGEVSEDQSQLLVFELRDANTLNILPIPTVRSPHPREAAGLDEVPGLIVGSCSWLHILAVTF